MELGIAEPEAGPYIYPDADGLDISCVLCLFGFSEGNKIVSHEKRLKKSIFRISTFSLSKGFSTPYHPDCFRIVGHQSYHNISEITYSGLSFEGSHHLKERRRRWLVDTFAKNLFQILLGRLPREVCRNIAVYFAREQAMQVFQQLLSKNQPLQPEDISVPVFHGVKLWAQYINYEGNRYIRSLSHGPRGGDEDIVLDWNTQRLPNIFIRHNGLGVNKIIVTEGSEAPKGGIFYFTARFDGFKIRRLTISQSTNDDVESIEVDYCDIRWAIPAAPVRHSPKILLCPYLDSAFVRAFDWNKPGTLGYSFLLRGDAILHFNSHQAGTLAGPEEYERFDDYDVKRLYLAMSPGERVSKLLIRTYHRRLSTLIVVTNYGRGLVAGTQADKPGATYHTIAELPQNKPCRMFHVGAYQYSISWLHFDSVPAWLHPENHQIQPTWKNNFPIGPYHTSVKLYDVREVTPCIFWRAWYFGDDEKIRGLLLTYTNGSRGSVGEIRPDKLGTPIPVTSDTMFLQYKGPFCDGPDAITHMVEYGLDWFGFSEPLVSADEESEDTDGKFHGDGEGSELDSTEVDGAGNPVKYTNTMVVPMSGRLDWVVSEHDDLYTLSHHKRSVPEDEMRHLLAQRPTATTEDLIVKSVTNLIGDVRPSILKKVYQPAEDIENWDIFGL